MSTWSRASKRTYLLEGNGFITSDGKIAKVPGPNSYNQPISPRIRGTMSYAPVHGKSDREKILSNGVRLSGMSPLGPGTYDPKRVAGPGSARSVPQGSSLENNPTGGSSGNGGVGVGKGGSGGFGTNTKRAELYPDKNIPGPGDYDLSLPSLSKRGKFIDTSPRKCCSPVQKEQDPVLSPSQQQWLARTTSSNNASGDYGESTDGSLAGSLGRSGGVASGGLKNYHRNGASPPVALDLGVCRGFGQSSGNYSGTSAVSPPHPPGGGSPTFSDSLGRRRIASPSASPRGPMIKGGTISGAARPMNMHNLNSTLAREKDPDFANPSPGAYETNQKKSTDRQLGGRISQSPRNCTLINPKQASIPGPGSYELSGGPGTINASYGPSGLQ